MYAQRAVSDSEYGFIGEVFHKDDGSPFLKNYAITNITWNEQARSGKMQTAPILLGSYANDPFVRTAVEGVQSSQRTPVERPTATGGNRALPRVSGDAKKRRCNCQHNEGVQCLVLLSLKNAMAAWGRIRPPACISARTI
jgi:hypothetical protein